MEWSIIVIKILIGIGLGWLIFTYADYLKPMAEDIKDRACETYYNMEESFD